MSQSPEITQVLRLSAVACLAISKTPAPTSEKLQLMELVLSSVYNRGLSVALMAAIVDGLTQGEALNRAKLLSDMATHEVHQALSQIEELCK